MPNVKFQGHSVSTLRSKFSSSPYFLHFRGLFFTFRRLLSPKLCSSSRAHFETCKRSVKLQRCLNQGPLCRCACKRSISGSASIVHFWAAQKGTGNKSPEW